VGAETDVVIVGAGLAGAATAWSLTRRDRSVVLVEQFVAGHTSGSSHGSARIVHRAYGDGLYVSLTGAAFELWREVESGSRVSLLRMLGGLDFGPGREVSGIAALLASYLASLGTPAKL
jgi:glycine/D-amino acid oxidase-like deaminating enzyme